MIFFSIFKQFNKVFPLAEAVKHPIDLFLLIKSYIIFLICFICFSTLKENTLFLIIFVIPHLILFVKLI